MSFVFGVVSPQKEEISDLIQEMYQGIKEEPHQEKILTTYDNAGFGYLETKKTAVHKRVVSENDTLFTAKGRLDNRRELLIQLNLSPRHTDAEVMHEAWKKWGKTCVKYLRGDWAFAAYSGHKLFLARDPHGYTALYYYVAKNRLFFSSSPKGILPLACFKKSINLDLFLGDLLILPPNPCTGTGYKDLKTLPPAHTLQFSNGIVSLTQYWNPECIEIKNYKNHQQYAEELLELFREAVRVRLDSDGNVASMLSGGLDSGSVAAVAADLLKSQGKKLKTFSHVPAYSSKYNPKHLRNRMCDESENIQSTASFSGNIEPSLLTSSLYSPTQGIRDVVDKLDMYFHGAGNAYWMLDICKRSSAQGYEGLLSGEMGNATISFSGISTILPWHHTASLKNPGPWLKQNLKNFLTNRLPYSPFSRTRTFAHYINCSYVDSTFKEEALDLLNARSHFLSTDYSSAKEAMLKIIGVGTNLRCAIGQRMGDAFGIELRDPTGDLNVIEYCLSIPNEAFFSTTIKGKSILLNMMKNYLPPDVLYSPKKGLQSADLAERLSNDVEGVENLYSHISKSAQVNEIFDLKLWYKDWLSLDANTPLLQAQQFSKALMFAYFLSKVDT